MGIDDDEVAGRSRNVQGRIKEAAGALTGDRRLEAEGTADRVAGSARESFGRATSETGGRFENLAGRVQQGFGAATGDRGMEARGFFARVRGAIRETLGGLRRRRSHV